MPNAMKNKKIDVLKHLKLVRHKIVFEKKRHQKIYRKDATASKTGFLKRSYNLIRKSHHKPRVISPLYDYKTRELIYLNKNHK